MEGREHLYIGRGEDGRVAFMSLLFPLKGTDMVLLDYMATDERSRGQGIGSSFLRTVPELIGTDKHLLLEVEHPGYGSDPDIRTRRVAFYGRHGARLLKGVGYKTLIATVPVPMVLMVMPGPSSGRMDGANVRNIIKRVYREVYGRDERDPLVISIIEAVPGTVELG